MSRRTYALAIERQHARLAQARQARSAAAACEECLRLICGDGVGHQDWCPWSGYPFEAFPRAARAIPGAGGEGSAHG